ncbi:MAG: hypothetical protein ACWGMZ_07820, partial [Thermoguttaceae bacterium]
MRFKLHGMLGGRRNFKKTPAKKFIQPTLREDQCVVVIPGKARNRRICQEVVFIKPRGCNPWALLSARSLLMLVLEVL